MRAAVASSDLATQTEALEDWAWKPVPSAQTATCLLDPGLRDLLEGLDITYETEEREHGADGKLREQVDAIERWYRNDWVALDAKLRTSIVEGISVVLSLFDQPQVAGRRMWRGTVAVPLRTSTGDTNCLPLIAYRPPP